jgi:hypothetical protein
MHKAFGFYLLLCRAYWVTAIFTSFNGCDEKVKPKPIKPGDGCKFIRSLPFTPTIEKLPYLP